MKPSERDIQAAAKIVGINPRSSRRFGKTFVAKIAEALAQAREEGRREGAEASRAPVIASIVERRKAKWDDEGTPWWHGYMIGTGEALKDLRKPLTMAEAHEALLKAEAEEKSDD